MEIRIVSYTNEESGTRHLIDRNGIKPNDEKESILETAPNNANVLKSLLGTNPYLPNILLKSSQNGKTDRIRRLLEMSELTKLEDDQEKDFTHINRMLTERTSEAHNGKKYDHDRWKMKPAAVLHYDRNKTAET